SSTPAATSRWGTPGTTSTSPRSAVRRHGRTRRRGTPKPRRTSGGTTTTPTPRVRDHPPRACRWDSRLYHVVMATLLSLDDHLAALVRSGAGLVEAAAAAGLEAKVPTAPARDVTG